MDSFVGSFYRKFRQTADPGVFLGSNKIPEGITDQHRRSIAASYKTAFLQNVRMISHDHIHSLFQKDICPFLLITVKVECLSLLLYP